MANASRRHQRTKRSQHTHSDNDEYDNEDTDEYHSPEKGGGEEIEEQELSGEEDEYDGNEMK